MSVSVASLKSLYKTAKEAAVGTEVKCPSCKTMFTKQHHQQAFCTARIGTRCKDFYWNNVTPKKRNNTTRISPANAAYMERMAERRERDCDDDHPFSSEGLGQWCD